MEVAAPQPQVFWPVFPAATHMASVFIIKSWHVLLTLLLRSLRRLSQGSAKEKSHRKAICGGEASGAIEMTMVKGGGEKDSVFLPEHRRSLWAVPFCKATHLR